MKHILSKADIVLFIILILIAAVGIILLSGSGSGETAVVRLDGEIIKQVSLDVDQTFYINNVCIQVKDGAIAIIESDCPTQACVKTGWLNTPGATVACLPNKISITVLGDSEVDAIAE